VRKEENERKGNIMTLYQRQLKAVRETREKCMEEDLKGVGHDWNMWKCPLCRKFYDGVGCQDCPIGRLDDYFIGCIILARYPDGYHRTATPLDMASFLYSLELYLEETGRAI